MKTQTLLLILLFTTPLVKANWTPKADFPSSARYSAIYFSIGNNGYIGMGYNSTYRNDLWEYVPSTDSWTQKADYPTFGRNAAACFTINNLGYVACGGNGVNSAQSLYAFSPLLNSWISKAAYPVNPAPQDCFGFAIGNKGYVVGGWNGSTQDDCYEYDATNDSWTQKTSFPGGNRSGITGFVIGNLAYVGTGFFNGGYYTDFYSYDPSNDTWALRTAFPGAARCSGSGFSIGNYGYMGIGYDGANFFHDFWKYDPQNDSWVTVNNYPGNGGEYSAAFTIGGRGFVGTGGTNGGPYYNNYFEFTDATSEITESKKSSDIKVTYSGIENYIYISSENNFTENLIFNLYNNNGQLVCSKHLKSSENSTTIHLQKKVAGSFFYSITGGNKINISGKIDIL